MDEEFERRPQLPSHEMLLLAAIFLSVVGVALVAWRVSL